MIGETTPERRSEGRDAYSLPRRLLWGYLKILSQAAGILFWDCRAFHQERLPAGGRFIIAPNHQSYLDPWLIGLAQKHILSFLARDSLFRFGFGQLIAALNALPVARESQAPKQGIEVSVRALRSGQRLVLFPEGTRTSDGSMGSLKRGIYIIARQGDCAVVPAYIDGAFALWPRGQALPRPGSIRIYFGRPLWHDGRRTGERQDEAGRRAEGSRERRKNAGDLERLVEDGWARTYKGGVREHAEPSPGESPGTTTGIAAKHASPETEQGTTPATDPVATTAAVSPEPAAGPEPAPTKPKSSAVFLRQLGEAYRALEDEAKRRRAYLSR